MVWPAFDKAFLTPQDRAQIRAGERARQRKRKQQVISLLGGICKRCGFSDERALQIDHIKGGGSDDPRRKGSYRAYYKSILALGAKAHDEFQLLCANCNWIKVFENKEYLGKQKNIP